MILLNIAAPAVATGNDLEGVSAVEMEGGVFVGRDREPRGLGVVGRVATPLSIIDSSVGVLPGEMSMSSACSLESVQKSTPVLNFGLSSG